MFSVAAFIGCLALDFATAMGIYECFFSDDSNSVSAPVFFSIVVALPLFGILQLASLSCWLFSNSKTSKTNSESSRLQLRQTFVLFILNGAGLIIFAGLVLVFLILMVLNFRWSAN